jgi:hypothetical protein
MIGSIEKYYGLETVFIALGGFGIALVVAVLVLIGVTRSNSREEAEGRRGSEH